MSDNTGAVGGVIFDLSGTVIDHGSRGPVVAFVELFARHGVEVSEAEARKPMGAHKRDHIEAMLGEPAIAERWRQAKGCEPGQGVLDLLYAEFTPLLIEVLEKHSDVLEGVPEMTAELRRRGIRFASTTGFDSGMIGGLRANAIANGYSPEIFVTPDIAGGGRPAPWMAFHAARHMNVYPMRRIVKVGDTAADVAEAHNAGMWAVAVTATGNEVGLSREQLAALAPEEAARRIDAARRKFESLGAHYAIESAAGLPAIIDCIEERLARGERPQA